MKPMKLQSVLSLVAISFLTNFALAAKLSPTIYYIKTIDLNQECSTKKTIFSVDGKALFKVCKESYNSCVIEGTCALITPDPKPASITEEADQVPDQLDFEIINYVKSDNKGLPLFEDVNEQKCPYGFGVQAICLDPFYTVAADLDYHKAGDVIYIDHMKGVKLPNGEIHSGFFIVRDRGGAIKGPDRFDFFTGLLNYRDTRNPFTPVGFATSTNRFEYRKATAEETTDFHKLRNFPKVPAVN